MLWERKKRLSSHELGTFFKKCFFFNFLIWSKTRVMKTIHKTLMGLSGFQIVRVEVFQINNSQIKHTAIAWETQGLIHTCSAGAQHTFSDWEQSCRVFQALWWIYIYIHQSAWNTQHQNLMRHILNFIAFVFVCYFWIFQGTFGIKILDSQLVCNEKFQSFVELWKIPHRGLVALVEVKYTVKCKRILQQAIFKRSSPASVGDKLKLFSVYYL